MNILGIFSFKFSEPLVSLADMKYAIAWEKVTVAYWTFCYRDGKYKKLVSHCRNFPPIIRDRCNFRKISTGKLATFNALFHE